MVKLSKRKKEFKKEFSPDQEYTIDEAVENISKFPKAKFDESIELHLALNINPKNSDQMVRGTVILPNGLGKKVRVCVICKGEMEIQAKEAGADLVGNKDLIEQITKGFLGFDVVIAAPDMMRDLSRLGKILGPRGLMPTPKAGTVTTDVAKAITEAKAGKVAFKSDKQAGIHAGIGKRSFDNDKILENIKELVDAVNNARPAVIKGNLIRSAYLSTTMGPGLRLKL
ncbi:MAG: 50S ribosomal protein L1 [Candidatus Omnitrophica bacterium]|nr:50S ribosomal protein L1 [Candidatus Omnitrophota bacterium]